MKKQSKNKCLAIICVGLLALTSQLALGNTGPFSGGWVLDNAASSLTFQTIKNGSKLETSSFASYQGEVDQNGQASLKIQLDSVDTKVDLRNVRMRFLLFETFKYAEATVTANVDPGLLADLATTQRVQIPLSFELDLHGVQQTLQTQTIVTALANGQVSVASAAPISIPTELFNLDEGVKKLEEAATVTIVPMGSVSFNLVFDVLTDSNAVVAAARVEAPTGAAAAVESTGNFSKEECAGRLEILSRTKSVYFAIGSAALDPKSDLILDSVMGIISRCPTLKVVVAGHTDSAGSEDLNQSLSEARARSVVDHLISNQVDPDRLISVGYGELRPIATNETKRGRWQNRRIEFSIDDDTPAAPEVVSAASVDSNVETELSVDGPLLTVNTSLGKVIAGGPDRKTLYTFANDNGAVSTCYAACANAWPPFVVDDPSRATASLTIANRSDGVAQWVYKGKPLYFWAGDSAEGQTTGASIADWAVAIP